MEKTSDAPAAQESRHKAHRHHKEDKKRESRHKPSTKPSSEDKAPHEATEAVPRVASPPPPPAVASSTTEEEDWEQNQRTVEQLCATYPNNMCCDCNENGTRWAAVNLGVFICIRCSGIHRALGVHVSKVKSTNMDRWTSAEVAMMAAMGNARGKALYEAHLPPELRPVAVSSTSSDKNVITDSALRAFIERKYVAMEFAAVDVKAVLRRVHRQTGYSKRHITHAHKKEVDEGQQGDKAEGAAEKTASEKDDAAAAPPKRKVNTAEAMRAFYGVDTTTAMSATRSAKAKEKKASSAAAAKRSTPAVHGTFGVVNVPPDVYDERLREVLAAFECEVAE